ncbi:MAG: glycosyltransferase family 39 protein, partial [Candidatus Omnitrophica bacterium]|nr:glycosyltransferase family 39 protein [Candidatus Omnitrophota bacterium]
MKNGEESLGITLPNNTPEKNSVTGPVFRRVFQKNIWIWKVGSVLLILTGIVLRFYRVTAPEFVFYDEGLYLFHNIDFLYYIQQNPAESFSALCRYLEIMFHVALSDAKAVWFFLSALRALVMDADALYFTRLLSACFGSLTIGVTFLFGKRYYRSVNAGLLAAVLLALLPSHVFYSRLGMQEAFSTFCFTLGLYWYVFSAGRHWKTFLSGVCFSLVFFSNYRMIIIPGIILFIETYQWSLTKCSFDVKKYIWNTLTFLLIVFGVGNLDQGANTEITFAWMFHQAHLS